MTKIDPFTVTVLENFAVINPLTWINEGSMLETASVSRSLIARANVDTVFPKSFGLFRLSQFINILNLYHEPEVSFEDIQLVVSSGIRSTKLSYGDPNLFKEEWKVPVGFKFPSSDIKASISSVVLRDLEKAVRYLGVEDLVIEGNGKDLTITATTTEKVGSNYHTICLGDTDRTFKAIVKHANMTLLPLDYEVEVIANKQTPALKFISDRIQYLVALDESSEF